MKAKAITHLSLDNCTTPVCGAKRAKSMSAAEKESALDTIPKESWKKFEQHYKGESPEIDKEQFSRRELEIAFCFGLRNQKDVTIDLLSEQLKTAEDKIELMVDAVIKLRTRKP